MLSLVGKERSDAIAANEISGLPVRRFLDTYDQNGNTEWSQGGSLGGYGISAQGGFCARCRADGS